MPLTETGFVVPRKDIVETTDWASSLVLVPHHFVQIDAIRQAMLGISDPQALAAGTVQAMVDLRSKYKDTDGYFADTIGKTQEERQKFEDTCVQAFQKIEALPDESKIHFDLPPDDFCSGCAVGTHCSATNYDSELSDYPYLIDAVDIEDFYLNELRKLLGEEGFLENVDFKNITTKHTLVDFDGNKLNRPPKQTNIITVEFNSLIATTASIRKIYRRMKAS